VTGRLRAGLEARRAAVGALWGTGAGRVALVLAGVLVAGTVVGLAALWPRDPVTPGAATLPPGAEQAEVVGVTTAGCRPELGPGCRLLQIRLDGGERTTAVFAGDALSPLVEPGATIRVVPRAGGAGAGAAAAPGAGPPWVFLDYDRRAPLLLLALAFALVIGVLARWRGLLALLGLAASLFLLARFVVPAILAGRPPVLVAVVGALAVLLVTLALAHGVSAVTLAAALGASASLALTAALAALAVEAAQLTGLASEGAIVLRTAAGGTLEPQGLLLAGIVIGALGVLDDVTVTQASTVAALRRTAPAAAAGRLYREAITVGRDHLAATVNTLALAYAGAALPVLLFFSTTATPLAEAANREVVAQELVALLVGSIGLACAVPLTTAVAVALVRRLPVPVLDAAGGAPAGHTHR